MAPHLTGLVTLAFSLDSSVDQYARQIAWYDRLLKGKDRKEDETHGN